MLRPISGILRIIQIWVAVVLVTAVFTHNLGACFHFGQVDYVGIDIQD